jgi:hypothetical protein
VRRGAGEGRLLAWRCESTAARLLTQHPPFTASTHTALPLGSYSIFPPPPSSSSLEFDAQVFNAALLDARAVQVQLG